MTQQEAVLDLLAFVGIYGFTDNQDTNVVNGEDDADINRAVSALNAALQEIYRAGPLSLKFGSKSAFFNAPTQVTLTMTAGAGGTSGTQLPQWMRGCSIQIDGDSVLNRILDITGDTIVPLRGYLGPTGVHQATVYGDAYLLEDDVAAVLEPVEIAPNRRLRPAQGRIQFNANRYYDQYAPFAQYEKQVGTPVLYLVEQRLDSAFPGGSIYLSLNPMPSEALNLTFDVYRFPEVVDRGEALDEQGGDDPLIAFTSVHPSMVDSILMPIARWKFFTHPNLKNNEARNSVKGEHDAAMLKLSQGQGMDVQVAPTRAKYI